MNEHTDNPNDNDELRMRLLDVALAEKVGGQAPPDLSERILSASAAPETCPVDEQSTQPVSAITRRHWYLLAVAATLVIGVVPLLMMASSASVNQARMTVAKSEHVDKDVAQAQQSVGDPQAIVVGNEWKYSETGTRFSTQDAGGKRESMSQSDNIGLDGMHGVSVEGIDGGRPDSVQQLERERIAQQGEKSVRFFESSNEVVTEEFDEQVPGAGPAPGGGRPALAAQSGYGGYGYEPSFGGGRISTRDRSQPTEIRLGELRDRGGAVRSEAQVETWGFRRELGVELREVDQLGRGVGFGPPRFEEGEGQGPGDPGDQYARIYENPFYEAAGERAVSTFSIDVDRASYANVRQFLMQSRRLPPPDAVRIEELVNYFDYDYQPPASANDPIAFNSVMANAHFEAAAKGFPPFAAHVEVAGCPWTPGHRLVRIGIKGRDLDVDKRPQSNLVFLIDVSGSMDQPNKLPLVVDGMKELTRQLGENDRVAIVVYASSEGLVLPSTSGTEQQRILAALSQLRAGGSTAGGAGIQLAYQIAQDNFIEGGVNRVILCTDGDFNVGTTSTADLERIVEQKAKDTGVFLSVLGFGRGNLNDAMMETISNHGNGNYHYVDTENESRRVLVEEMAGTLVTIAKDVKIQVFFNPAQVAGYRLLGYENRMLRTQDFNDDTKDAGEIGAGHTVTALYEIVPAGEKVDTPLVDESPYVAPAAVNSDADRSNELLTLRMRYKQPDGDTSKLLEWPVTDDGQTFTAASKDFQFASAVAGFGMLLRNSEHKGNLTYSAVEEIASGGVGDDPDGRRGEFLSLVERAKQLSGE